MDQLKKIEDKIQQLGGVKLNPGCDKSEDALSLEKSFNQLHASLGIEIPESYKSFYLKYGPVSFNNMIEVTCMDIFPFAGEGNKVNVDYFKSTDSDSAYSIIEALSILPGEFSGKLLPICDGEPGDLICLVLDKKNYGCVCYWYHEGGPSNELFLIARTFEEFILKLQIAEDDDRDQLANKDIKLTASPKLLEMLAKSGYGPKK